MRAPSKKQIEKWKWACDYIRREGLEDPDRHITAILGSAGYTFVEDIAHLANWAEENGYRDVAARIDYKFTD